MNELNQKHLFIKFSCKFDCKLIEFVDTLAKFINKTNYKTLFSENQVSVKILLIQKRNYKQCIPSSVTYRRELPNLKDILTKHWYILQTNQRCGKTFSTFPAIVFKTDTSLRQNIFTNVVHNNKKIIKSKINHQKGKCVPCHSKRCFCFQESRHCFNKNIQRN